MSDKHSESTLCHQEVIHWLIISIFWKRYVIKPNRCLNYWWSMVGLYLLMKLLPLFCSTYLIHFNNQGRETKFLLLSKKKNVVVCLLPCRRGALIDLCLSIVYKSQRTTKWAESSTLTKFPPKYTCHRLQKPVLKARRDLWKSIRIWKSLLYLESLKFLQQIRNVRKISQTHLNPEWLQCLLWFSIRNGPHSDLRQRGMCSLRMLTSKFQVWMSSNSSIVWNKNNSNPKWWTLTFQWHSILLF